MRWQKWGPQRWRRSLQSPLLPQPPIRAQPQTPLAPQRMAKPARVGGEARAARKRAATGDRAARPPRNVERRTRRCVSSARREPRGAKRHNAGYGKRPVHPHSDWAYLPKTDRPRHQRQRSSSCPCAASSSTSALLQAACCSTTASRALIARSSRSRISRMSLRPAVSRVRSSSS